MTATKTIRFAQYYI